MTRLLIILCASLLFSSCSSKLNYPLNKYRKHRLKKDRRISNLKEIDLFSADTLRFDFYFPESSLEYGEAQVNRLYGFSNSADSRFSSASIGWWCTDSMYFTLYARINQEGSYLYQQMFDVPANDTVQATIIDTSKDWIIKLKNTKEYRFIRLPKTYGTYYNWQLYPCYGRSKPRKNIDVYIKVYGDLSE